MKSLRAAPLLILLLLTSCAPAPIQEAPPTATEAPTAAPTPEPTPSPEPLPVETRVFVPLGTFVTYGYDKCRLCCGEWADVPSPEKVPGDCVAADPVVLPKGTVIYIKGIGYRTVMDTGGGIKGKTLDIMYEDHETALSHGRQELEVWRVDG